MEPRAFLAAIFGRGITISGASYCVLAYDPKQGGWLGINKEGYLRGPSRRLLDAVQTLLPAQTGD